MNIDKVVTCTVRFKSSINNNAQGTRVRGLNMTPDIPEIAQFLGSNGALFYIPKGLLPGQSNIGMSYYRKRSLRTF